MRILHVVQKLDLSWGGLSLFVAEIAKAQANAGHHVHVLTGKISEIEARYELGGATQHVAPKKLARKQLIAAADITHIHGLWLPLYHRVAQTSRQLSKPYVLSPHGMLEPAALQFSRWRKRIAWPLFQSRDIRRAKLLHATASAERNTLRKYGTQPIVEAPPGVHFAETVASMRGDKKRDALYLGRLHPIKGIDLLVEAWLAVAPVGWRLRIAGPDESSMKQRLADVIIRSGKEVEIEWLGPVYGAQKEHLLAESSLVVVPSRSENFAITVIEGLANGSPVITTDATPWTDLAERGVGWVCAPSVSELSNALRDACNRTAAELRAMGEVGRDWVRADFRWESSSQKLLDAYAWACGSGYMPESVFC